MRIFITGNAGSGKTTLAQKLGRVTGLPVIGLDKIVWQPGWKKTPRECRIVQERVLAEGECWIVDGVSYIIQDAADVVIFLDVPRSKSFFRCMKRNWGFMFGSRPDLPRDCPEFLILPYLTKLIYNFPNQVKPKILAKMQMRKYGQFLVRNDRDLSVAFQHLGIDQTMM